MVVIEPHNWTLFDVNSGAPVDVSYLYVGLMCDGGCNTGAFAIDEQNHAWTEDTARAKLKPCDWVTQGNKDFCGFCSVDNKLGDLNGKI